MKHITQLKIFTNRVNDNKDCDRDAIITTAPNTFYHRTILFHSESVQAQNKRNIIIMVATLLYVQPR